LFTVKPSARTLSTGQLTLTVKSVGGVKTSPQSALVTVHVSVGVGVAVGVGVTDAVGEGVIDGVGVGVGVGVGAKPRIWKTWSGHT
jgi:hypothetical protein